MYEVLLGIHGGYSGCMRWMAWSNGYECILDGKKGQYGAGVVLKILRGGWECCCFGRAGGSREQCGVARVLEGEDQ